MSTSSSEKGTLLDMYLMYHYHFTDCSGVANKGDFDVNYYLNMPV